VSNDSIHFHRTSSSDPDHEHGRSYISDYNDALPPVSNGGSVGGGGSDGAGGGGGSYRDMTQDYPPYGNFGVDMGVA